MSRRDRKEALFWVMLLAVTVLLYRLANGPERPSSAPPEPTAPARPSQDEPVPELPDPEPPEEVSIEGCPIGCVQPPSGCEIKGNISTKASREKIYHLPSNQYYGRTVIDPGKGEKWFCTEEEARANGWRRAKV
jgi:hypothetical protein